MPNRDFHIVAQEVLAMKSNEELFRQEGYKYSSKLGGPKGAPVSLDIQITRLGGTEPVARLEALTGTNEILVTKEPTREEIGLEALGKVYGLMGQLAAELIEKVRGDDEIFSQDLGLVIFEDEDGDGDFISFGPETVPEVTVKLCDSGVQINERKVQWAMRELLSKIRVSDTELDNYTLNDPECGKENNKFWDDLRDWDLRDLAKILMEGDLHDKICVDVNVWKGIRKSNSYENTISKIKLKAVRGNRHKTALTIAEYFKKTMRDHEVIKKY